MSKHQGPLNEQEIKEVFDIFPLPNATIGLSDIGPAVRALSSEQLAKLNTEGDARAEKWAKEDAETLKLVDADEQMKRDLRMAQAIADGKFQMLSSQEIQEKHKGETDPFQIEMNKEAGEHNDRILALVSKLKAA